MDQNPNEAHPIAIALLSRKRAQIAAQIAQAKKQAERLRVDLVHLDAVIRMLRPDMDPEAIPPMQRLNRSAYFKHGELTQLIYDTLRERGEVSSADVAIAAMRAKGLDPDNDRAVRIDFVRRAGLQINTLMRKGKVERTGRGRTLRYRLIGSLDL